MQNSTDAITTSLAAVPGQFRSEILHAQAKALAQILIQETTFPSDLYGKTGTGTVLENHSLENSWFVGWVEKGNETDIFVMNALAPANTNSPNAVKDLLEKEGLF